MGAILSDAKNSGRIIGSGASVGIVNASAWPGRSQVFAPGVALGRSHGVINENAVIANANGSPYIKGGSGLGIFNRPNTSTELSECAYWYFTARPLSNNASMLAVLSGASLAAYPCGVAYGSDGSGAGWGFKINLSPTGATTSYVDTTPASFSASVSSTIADNEIVVVGAVKNGSKIKCFFRGKVAEVTGGNGSIRSSGYGLCSDRANDGASNAYGYGHTFLAAITDVALSDAAMFNLLDVPNTILSVPKRLIWGPEAAAATYLPPRFEQARQAVTRGSRW